MKVVFLIAAFLIGLVLVIVVIGALLPRTHKATRSAFYKRKPAELYAAISDLAAQPSWRTGLTSIEIQPPRSGHVCFRENSRHGAITYVIQEDIIPTRRVTRIADESLPFGGTWTYEIAADQNGSLLRITEDGEVKNVLFRFLARFVFGYERTMDTYLRDLGEHFRESITPLP